MNRSTNDNSINCPKCKSQNIQSEGLLHLCLDCGYKWEDAPDGDLGEMVIYQSDEGIRLDVRLESNTVWLNQDQIVNIFPIFSKKENWTSKWLFGNSEQPLNMAQ